MPGITLTANSLQVIVNTLGYNPATLSGLPTTISTPTGPVSLNFSGIGANNIEVVSGTITLSVASVFSISGDFGFEALTTGGVSVIEVAAERYLDAKCWGRGFECQRCQPWISHRYGEHQYANADHRDGGLIRAHSQRGHRLLDRHSRSVRLQLGFDGLVNNTGVNPNNLPGVGQGIPTPDGSLTLGFSAFTNADTIKEVYGSISLNIAGLVSVSGNFVFEETGTGSSAEIIIGASDIDATVGTSTTNVSITDASLSLAIIPGTGGGANNTPSSPPVAPTA